MDDARELARRCAPWDEEAVGEDPALAVRELLGVLDWVDDYHVEEPEERLVYRLLEPSAAPHLEDLLPDALQPLDLVGVELLGVEYREVLVAGRVFDEPCLGSTAEGQLGLGAGGDDLVARCPVCARCSPSLAPCPPC